MSKEFDPIQVSGYEEAEKDLTPKPVDEGEYDVRVVDFDVKESAAGEQMANWTFEVFGDDDEANNGRKVFTNTMLEGRGFFGFTTLAKACRNPWEGEEITSEYLSSFIGLELAVVVKHREYEGKLQADVTPIIEK